MRVEEGQSATHLGCLGIAGGVPDLFVVLCPLSVLFVPCLIVIHDSRFLEVVAARAMLVLALQ